MSGCRVKFLPSSKSLESFKLGFTGRFLDYIFPLEKELNMIEVVLENTCWFFLFFDHVVQSSFVVKYVWEYEVGMFGFRTEVSRCL